MGLPPFALLAEDHPLAGEARVALPDLAAHPMVFLDLPVSADYFLDLFRAAGVTPRIVERTRDMAVMRSLVANGFGYSLANLRPLTEVAPDGRRLRIVPLAGPVEPVSLGLVLAEGARRVRTIGAFVEHARGEITEERRPGLRVEG